MNDIVDEWPDERVRFTKCHDPPASGRVGDNNRYIHIQNFNTTQNYCTIIFVQLLYHETRLAGTFGRLLKFLGAFQIFFKNR